MKIYSIYDKKSETYSLPFYAPADEVACRVVISAMIDRRVDFYIHAEDYSLRVLGDFRESDGNIESIDPVVVKTCEELAHLADKIRSQKFKEDENE